MAKKYLTIDILKKLFYPAVVLAGGCVTTPWYHIGNAPTIVCERLTATPGFGRFGPGAVSYESMNYFSRPVVKIATVANPLAGKVSVTLNCDYTPIDVVIPPYSQTPVLYETDARNMYDRNCFIEQWSEELNGTP